MLENSYFQESLSGFMDKRKALLAIPIIILSALFVYSFPQLGLAFSNLPQEHKHLWSAIVVSGIGLSLHFIKKRKDITPEAHTVGELLEILMFMIIPVFALYQILQDEIKVYLILIPVIYLFTMLGWYLICMYLIQKEYYDKGDQARGYIHRFFWTMEGAGIGLTVLVMVFFPLD